MMQLQTKSKNYVDIKFHDQSKRNLLLILPGGGYQFTSPRESEPVRHVFESEAYHSAIFYYREDKLLFPELLDEGLLVLESLKKMDAVYQIYVMGFSAGGHYAALLSTHYHHLIDKTLLIYPVISAHSKYIHKGSYETLIGSHAKKDAFYQISLEHHVHKDMKPVFIFHTMDDQNVPVENSLLYLYKLKKQGIFVEAHFYPTGRHGVSIATKDVAFQDMDPIVFVDAYGYLSAWVELAKAFLRRKF